MPLVLYEETPPTTRLGVWRIEEEEAFFLTHLALSPSEAAQLAVMKGPKRLEFLAARQIVHLLSGFSTRLPLEKDHHGKPFLPGTALQVSISHTNRYAAAFFGKDPVGVDIQYMVEKIERIAPKFLNEEEKNQIGPHRLAHLHVCWCAKEALYKAYGQRGLDFRQHILLSPFDYAEGGGTLSGVVQKEDRTQKFTIFYAKIEDCVLVWAIQTP
jgi:4'-phosphopantetheinyl transferase